MMYCHKCGKELSGDMDHFFAVYDNSIQFCPECCPGELDGTPCRECEEEKNRKRMTLNDIFDQFDRYGGLFSDELEEILILLTDINDDYHHGRDREGIEKTKQKLIQLIDKL